MPTNCEQLQRVYEVPYDRHIPEAEYYHGHGDNLED